MAKKQRKETATTNREIHRMVKCPRGEIVRMIFISSCRKGGVDEPDGCVFYNGIIQNDDGSHSVVCRWPVLPEGTES